MSAQLRKLFRIVQSSVIQNLRIFVGAEGICFEFTILSWFWKIKKNKQCGTHLSASVSE
jgi:hypothetical protein